VISVLLVVRNVEATIGAAVRSILQQTVDDWELLLIDDGSRDATVERMRRFDDSRIRLFVDGQARGLASRLNEGLREARGEFVARMDGDDVSYPERFAVQGAFLRAHPHVDLVGAAAVVFRGAGNAYGVRRVPERHEQICRPPWGFSVLHPTFFARTAWLREWGYRASNARAQDQELLLRSHFKSTFANVPQLLLGYREERVSIRKSLRGRREYLRSVATTYGARGEYRPIAAVAVVHAARFAADVGAVALGRTRTMLRHRAMPATPEELSRWRDVWASVHPVEATPPPHRATPET